MERDKRIEVAKQILEDEMSDGTLEHIEKIDYLKDWIIDAMLVFSDSEKNRFINKDNVNWFESIPTNFKYTYYFLCGIFMGYLISYI